MSFSNPTPTTPVKRTFKWAGSTGDMTWYNRDNKERIKLGKPFRFIVLDELSAISGFNKETETGIWSNEIRNTKDGTLVVKAGNSVLARGRYDQIKDTIKSKGGKYTRAAYVLFEDTDGSWVEGKIMMAGSALGAWFDFRKDFSPDEVGIELTGSHEDQTGTTKYFVPVYEPFEIKAEVHGKAVEADRKLQKYLETYANNRPEAAVDEAQADEPDVDDIDVDLDKPIDLSEIPF